MDTTTGAAPLLASDFTAASTTDPVSPDHRLPIRAAQVQMLYAQAKVGILVTLVNSVVVTAILWPVVTLPPLLLWQGLVAAAALGRALLVWRYQRTSSALQALERWRWRFIAGTALVGLAWGLAGVLCFPHGAFGHQFFLALVLCGMGVGAVAVFASDLRAFLAFLLPTMSPITVRFFLQGDSIYLALGSLSLVLMAALLLLARNLHRSLLESLRLRFENLDLVQHLTLAKNRAEEASRIKSQFLANMSHEIRTPMNGVLGMTELILGQELPEKARHYATQAHASAHALLTLINDILDLSKIEAGKVELEHIAFDPHRVVTEVAMLFAAEADKKGLQWCAALQPEVPHVLYGDPYRLRQVLTNLVANALKFTSHGTVRLEVRVSEAATADTCQLHFAIQDTGVGVPVDIQPQLFQPFSQGDGSMTRKYGGTGLGLVISKQLVELMGGHIGVQSSAGQGATFWFTSRFGQPRAEASASGPLAAAVHCLPRDQGATALEVTANVSHPRVLLVEDNAINQEITRAMLEFFGCQVDVAETAADALAAFDRVAYEIILMDCQMPDMDGCEATLEMRRREGTGRRTPIIAVTAHSMEDDRARCLAAGMDDYLSKPFSQEDLERMVMRWLPAPHTRA